MSTRACASAGITVLGVAGSVWPAHRPWRLSVGSKVSRSAAAMPSTPADELPRGPGARAGRRARAGRAVATTARWAGASAAGRPVSRPRDRRPSVGVPERRERRDQPLARVRQERRHARVRVDPHRPEAQLEHDDALAAGDHDGRPRRSSDAALDQRGVGHAEVGAQVEQRVEGVAARLLLALDEVPDAARERADRREPCLDRPDARAGTRPCCRWRRGPRRGRRGSRARTGGVVHSSSGEAGWLS